MSLKKVAKTMADNRKVLDCMVYSLRASKREFPDHDVPLHFELIDYCDSYTFKDDYIEWYYKEDDHNRVYGLEVNYIIYEDDKYLMLDTDDGCGANHCNVLFLKEKQK